MEKVLGLDLGTNSIGWAVVMRPTNEDEKQSCKLVDKGVHIFRDGVAHEKSGEKPAVQDRTNARASRRHYDRKRHRKIELLKILIDNNLCPPLPTGCLDEWQNGRVYPMDKDFIAWQRTDDNEGKNPYHDRYICLTRRLDFTNREDRYILGRALYHLCQRRGFLCNRKDSSGDADNGKVKEGISSLTKEMEKAGCRYLGEFFYKCYGKDKIRTRYTARIEHYKSEFNAICSTQGLSPELIRSLERAIFYQRPLKSQKGNVGKCVFEKAKPRCPISHPRFEEFRLWQFVNSINVSISGQEERSLTDEEIETILPLFFRKSSPNFDFEDIAKKLAGKKNYAYRSDKGDAVWRFNYKMTANVSGCPVLAAILSAIKIEPCKRWEPDVCSLYTKGEGKSEEQIINDIWHALFSFDDEDKLTRWIQDSLQLDEANANKLAKARIPDGYASLSLKAINKILPWLKKGYYYSHAVFFANLDEALPTGLSDKRRKEIEENIQIELNNHNEGGLHNERSLVHAINDYLVGAAPGVRTDKLYHPSMIELYPQAVPDTQGRVLLGSPRTDAFKNPMALRALFRLRALVNQLLKDGVIDTETRINIEFARELNDTNRRKAIEEYQRELFKQKEEDRKILKQTYLQEFGREIEPTEEDLLKYRLYEEQGHICLYTGKQISISKFLGTASEFDIEHTIPRSKGGDDSQMNKTLCDSHFNRFVKKAKLPSELEEKEIILQRVDSWREKAESLEKAISSQIKKSRMAVTKEEKDNAIRRKHFLSIQRDYWKGKYERFVMTSIPEGFSNRQGVDIGIIGRYARMYLQTVFHKIYIVKGATTASFRKAWGLQDEYTKKDRVNHSHHCIDAVTIACIGKMEYDRWKLYVEKLEQYERGESRKPHFEKPWPTFTEDVKDIPDELLVSHYTPDNMAKRSKKKLRIRGVIKKNSTGEPLYCQGDTARGSLHRDTYYGAINKNGEIRYVVRKSMDTLVDSDIKNIVDDVVREKVQLARDKSGSLKQAITDGIWMNKDKIIPIKKVRLYTSVKTPIALKKHRDQSEFEHKRSVYVTNDSNYCMAVYGDRKPSFKLYSNMEAVKNYKEYGPLGRWIPAYDEKGLPFRFVLKAGTMVLFWEDEPRELYACSRSELSKRLYKVIGFSSMVVDKHIYGRIYFQHSQEARPSSTIKSIGGPWKKGETYRPQISLLHTQLHLMVEGIDFEITSTGHIIFRQLND